MYAEFLGSFALIPSLILQHRKDENFLKFPHRFRASDPGVIHLPDDTLELVLHSTLTFAGETPLSVQLTLMVFRPEAIDRI